MTQGLVPFNKVEMQVIVYRGTGDPPDFIDQDEGVSLLWMYSSTLTGSMLRPTPAASFSTLFEVTADIKDAPVGIDIGPMGPFCVQEVDLVFSFGLTELKVQLAWKDENVSPSHIFPPLCQTAADYARSHTGYRTPVSASSCGY